MVKTAKQSGFYNTIAPQRTGAKEKEIGDMALTRKMLQAMGIEAEKIDQIIEAHSETVEGLKTERDKYKADAEMLPAVQNELKKAQDDLSTATSDGGWKEKHDTVKREFDEYKQEQEAKEARAAKEKAVRAYLESKNIKGSNLNIAMRGLNAEIDAAKLDGEGKLKDTKALDDLLSGDLSGLVTTTTEKGAPPPANPPANTGGSMTKAQIMGIKDRTERRAAIAANLDAFKKGD